MLSLLLLLLVIDGAVVGIGAVALAVVLVAAGVHQPMKPGLIVIGQ